MACAVDIHFNLYFGRNAGSVLGPCCYTVLIKVSRGTQVCFLDFKKPRGPFFVSYRRPFVADCESWPVERLISIASFFFVLSDPSNRQLSHSVGFRDAASKSLFFITSTNDALLRQPAAAKQDESAGTGERKKRYKSRSAREQR